MGVGGGGSGSIYEMVSSKNSDLHFFSVLLAIFFIEK